MKTNTITNKIIILFVLLSLCILFVACDLKPSTINTPINVEQGENDENQGQTGMELYIDDQKVSVVWEKNDAVKALKNLVKDNPLIIEMSMYGGFEQVGPIGTTLPRNDKQIKTQSGDIVLYSGSNVVIFYGSNSWSYTKLGKIVDKSSAEMQQLLGNGNVTIKITLGENNE